MDDFDSKEFYGFSLSNDPKLRTTTRNYEFKYNSPDHLERIINKVKLDREKVKQKRSLKRKDMPDSASFIRTQDLTSKAEHSNLLNVETDIGKSLQKKPIVKIMSEEEIEEMISQITPSIEKSLTTETVPEENSSIQQTRKKAVATNVSCEKQIIKDQGNVFPTNFKNVHKCSIEVLPVLQPQWVEIKPTQKALACKAEVLSNPCVEESSESHGNSTVNLAIKSLEIENLNIEDTESFDEGHSNITLDSESSIDLIPRNQESSEESDSNLESPLISGENSIYNDDKEENEHISKEVIQYPQLPQMDFESLNIEDDSESNSETEEIDEEEEELELIFNSNTGNNAKRPERTKKTDNFDEYLEFPSKSFHLANTKSTKTDDSALKPPKNTQNTIKETPLNRNKKMKTHSESKKYEKMRIFSKITSIQETIIDTLDKLRMNLLELSLPEGHAEIKLRERNAIEFSTRFSRNYIFPLGRMIEDLRNVSLENFNNNSTNEFCVKICGTYGLLNEALQCYKKQIRHFFTNNVPKKLDILLTLIMDTTKICLEKKIFDSQDTVIECLLLRCETFFELIMNFAEEKRTSDKNEEHRYGRKDRSKISTKWNSKINQKSLNMYEPKLNQKKPKRYIQKKLTKTVCSDESPKLKQTKKVNVVQKDKKVPLLSDDQVDTQVQKIENVDSLELIKTTLNDFPQSEAAKSLNETFQKVMNNDEIRDILEPLLSSLDSALKASGNPQTVERILNVLNSQLQKGFKQQLTENNTQNSNTYQNEETKKGTHSSKINRQRLIAKLKATSSYSNNVTEGSTEQTERYNSGDGRTDTICDKQSLSNIDIGIVVSENKSTIQQRTRSRSIVDSGGAFVPATAAKKPTPAAPAAIGFVQLDEVTALPIPRPKSNAQSPTQTTTSMPMTSRYLANNESVEGVNSQGFERSKEYSKGFCKKDISRVEGAVKALNETGGNQEAWRKKEPRLSSSPAKNGATFSGQIKHLNFGNNTMYTFIKYNEDQNRLIENIQETENKTNYSSEEEEQEEPEKNNEINSIESSNRKLLTQTFKTANEEFRKEEEIKKLLEERNNFIQRCKEDPLYENPQFPEPWKVLSRISSGIAREIIDSFENDISFGEETFVKDFINMEIES